MKRINGFLNIDEYFEIIKKKNNFTDDDLEYYGYYKESGYNYDHYWLLINGEKYYFKTSAYIYEEVIASECARFLGIDAVVYDLAEFKYLEGVISKSYRKEGYDYVSGDEILLEYLEDNDNIIKLKEMGYDQEKLIQLTRRYKIADSINTLEILWQVLEYRYPRNTEDIKRIMDNFVLIFILNILLSQTDGMPQNWEIEESIDGISLVPFFDGELMFKKLDVQIDSNCSLSVNFNDKNRSNYDILREFLKVSSQEFINLFIEKFNLLTIENFLSIIEQIERRIGTKIPTIDRQEIIDNFIENRERIAIILEELDNNRRGVR